MIWDGLASSAEIVLVGKDLGAIWRNKNTRDMMPRLLPVVLVVLIPLVYSVAISFLPAENSLALPEKIAAMVGGLDGYGDRGGNGWQPSLDCFVPCCFYVFPSSVL